MLNLYIIIIAAIIATCIYLNKLSSRFGIPVLLLFILLGLFSGWNDASVAEQAGTIESICTASLIFIMFYGGFGTKWSTARPIVKEAGILATLGVLATAGTTGLFCHFALKWGWVESFLMGSVISSTDAASVFSILRTRSMGLKNNTAPMLEVESGSNDPCSYMLTALMISILKGSASAGSVILMVFSQLFFGIVFGLLIAMGSIFLLKRIKFDQGFNSLAIVAIALLSYAIPSLCGGNGYLSAYIVGIVVGNTEFPNRKPLIHFFDGITTLMQILIFFLLGLMVIPSNLAGSLLPAVLIFLFLLFVGRPVAVFSILAPFKKYGWKQMGLVSFVGLRGAASIVFAIMTLTQGALPEHDIFSVVFCIVLISMSLQGSLIPFVAKKFDMIDKDEDVMKTFSDYSEDEDVAFGMINILSDSSWAGKKIMDLNLPKDFLITLIIRGETHIIPSGPLEIEAGDKVIICSRAFTSDATVNLVEHPLSPRSQWAGRTVKEYPYKNGSMLVMIKRGGEQIIPNGDTVLQHGDVLVILKQ